MKGKDNDPEIQRLSRLSALENQKCLSSILASQHKLLDPGAGIQTQRQTPGQGAGGSATPDRLSSQHTPTHSHQSLFLSGKGKMII